jgi:hypothetical protein
MGMILLIYLLSDAFVGSRPGYWHIFEIRLMLVSNYFASATIWACMLVGLKSLVISLDYQSYMGSSVKI